MSSHHPVSLSDIDPQLAGLGEAGNAQDNLGQEDAPQAQEQEDINQDQEDEGETSKSKKTKRKAQGTVKGSTADYKRKEANRLAAERSRSRQAERRANLVAASQRMAEEQRLILDEIARLEAEASGGTGSGAGVGVGVGSGSGYTLHRHQADEKHEPEPAPAVNQRPSIEQNPGDQGSSAMTTTEAMEAEAEAQAHSRTILAALMSDAEINQALVGDWMDQDEQEGDTSQVAPTSNHANNAPASNQEESSEQLQAHSPVTQQQQEEAVTSDAGKPGMAVSLHAEMERHLRDDLAATKIAIDQVEKELAVLRGIDPPAEGEQPTYESPLPANITSTDPVALDSLIETLESEHQQLAVQLPKVKERVATLMESRTAEAERLKTLLLKLKVDDEDKAAVDKILKPLSTHLDELLQSLSPERADALHAILGSHIAPAIAPRRRGRPPMHHPSTKQRGPRGTRTRKPRSRLSNAASAGAADTPEDSASGLDQDMADSVGRDILPLPRNRRHVDPSLQQGQSSQQPPPQPVVDLEMDHIPDMQAEMTTEELISQLANHDDQDLRDLLTSHAESEYANQQAIAAHMQQQLDSHSNPLDTPTQSVGHTQVGDFDGRFKQGPPGSCDICSRTETTVWRKIRHDDQDLHVCNPCGMYHIKTSKIRPPELWGDGKLIRTRRKSTHPRTLKGDAKRFKADGVEGSESLDTGEGQLEHLDGGLGIREDGNDENEDVQMAVANLGEVDGHDEFRASLGMAGIGDIMRNFGEQVSDDVSQDVANVFGSVG